MSSQEKDNIVPDRVSGMFQTFKKKGKDYKSI